MYAVTADRNHRNGWASVRRAENGIRMLRKSYGKSRLTARPVSGIETQKPKPVILSEIIADDEPRINMHDNELNRVLGGGLVPGSLVLIGARTGIGKSTLVMPNRTPVCRKRKSFMYPARKVHGNKITCRPSF